MLFYIVEYLILSNTTCYPLCMLPNKVEEALCGFKEEIQTQTCIIYKINEVII